MSATRRDDPTATTPPPTPTDRTPRLAVVLLCTAGIVVALTQTIIVPLIPQLPTMLHSSADNTSWALTITLLVGAAITPIGGRLGDMYGKRLMLLLSMACVAAGSVVCAVVDALLPFLIGRALQGMGFGAIALGISVMRDIVPARHLGSAVGTMSASLGIGGALGLPFAAIIAEHVNWHALFFVTAAFAVLCGVGLARTIPASPTRVGGRFDAVGAIGLIAILVCILLPLSKGATWGWGSPLTLGLFGAAAVVAVIWSLVERRVANPLVDLAVAMHRPVLLTNIASVAAGFAFYSMQLIPIQLLMAPTSSPNGLGLDMVTASLILTPSGLVMFVFSNISARIAARHGPRIALAVGGGILGVGYVVFLTVLIGPWRIGWPVIIAVACIIGAGLGIAYSAMPALIMRVVRVEQTGEANGVNALMRVVGTSASAATVGMILTWSAIEISTPAGPVSVPGESGYVWAAAISLVASVTAAVIALAIPTGRPVTVDDI
ncbi:MFS transporter [Gordonia soli]|uniref:Putative major facilitator superfamily transporter n=1 Tax=Gordonia soli NBRC 108243 TaxID=1223545 RepID=M0QMJ4_9ACTN|nr:MFS transporter [Gordonia soli]GAC69793.1 putative major facilitator superfamily transporter [Gordonia soli NBRC 108243]